MVQSAGGQVAQGSNGGVRSPLIGPLASNSTTPLSISGVWQDSSGNVCSDCTFSIKVTLLSSTYGTYSLAGSYQADPSCPAATGKEFVDSVFFGGNGSTTAPFYMALCTRPTNPIVQNCSQPSLWDTTFNATLTQNSITGTYLSQYWVWNTTSSGTIIPSTCHISYYFAEPFTLVPYSSSSAPPSNSSTSPQSSASSTNPVVQGSTSTSASSSTTTKSGLVGALPVLGLALLVVAVATGFVLIKWRPIRIKQKTT